MNLIPEAVLSRDRLCEAAGVHESAKGHNDHCKGVTNRDVLTEGEVQKIKNFHEGDLYRLTVRSQLPAAERFERWIFDEVPRTIRKHGLYAVDELLDCPDIAFAAFAQVKRRARTAQGAGGEFHGRKRDSIGPFVSAFETIGTLTDETPRAAPL